MSMNNIGVIVRVIAWIIPFAIVTHQRRKFGWKLISSLGFVDMTGIVIGKTSKIAKSHAEECRLVQ